MEIMWSSGAGGGAYIKSTELDHKNDEHEPHGAKVGRGNLQRMKASAKFTTEASSVMRSEQAAACWRDMGPTSRVVVTAHRSPDGDAVGSVLALAHHLNSRGIPAVAMLPDRYPDFLSWMPGAESISIFEESLESSRELLNSADVVWCLDFNAPERVGGMQAALEASPGKKWVVDHHRFPDEDFADRLFSDPSCGSTCELIFDLICSWGQESELNEAVATCLYTGMVTDTGSFRFSSVTAHTHEVVAHLLKTGMAHHRVHELTFDQQSIDQVRLLGYAMSEKLEVWRELGVALVTLDHDELARFKYRPGATEGLVNQALAIAGVRVAIFAKESEKGTIKLSFRSTGAIDVRNVAATAFEGGGHMNAAGGISKGRSMAELRDFLQSHFQSWFGS